MKIQNIKVGTKGSEQQEFQIRVPESFEEMKNEWGESIIYYRMLKAFASDAAQDARRMIKAGKSPEEIQNLLLDTKPEIPREYRDSPEAILENAIRKNPQKVMAILKKLNAQ